MSDAQVADGGKPILFYLVSILLVVMRRGPTDHLPVV